MSRFFAPGRANLIGEHTDHTDGLVPAGRDRPGRHPRGRPRRRRDRPDARPTPRARSAPRRRQPGPRRGVGPVRRRPSPPNSPTSAGRRSGMRGACAATCRKAPVCPRRRRSRWSWRPRWRRPPTSSCRRWTVAAACRRAESRAVGVPERHHGPGCLRSSAGRPCRAARLRHARVPLRPAAGRPRAVDRRLRGATATRDLRLRAAVGRACAGVAARSGPSAVRGRRRGPRRPARRRRRRPGPSLAPRRHRERTGPAQTEAAMARRTARATSGCCSRPGTPACATTTR